MKIFTYGTLMSGQLRTDMWCPTSRWDRTPAVAGGRLYSVRDAYPAFVIDKDSLTVGEILTPLHNQATRTDPIEDFYEVVEMELNAGYSLSAITAVATDKEVNPYAREQGVFVFSIPSDKTEWLTPIPGNDWRAYQNQLRKEW